MTRQPMDSRKIFNILKILKLFLSILHVMIHDACLFYFLVAFNSLQIQRQETNGKSSEWTHQLRKMKKGAIPFQRTMISLLHLGIVLKKLRQLIIAQTRSKNYIHCILSRINIYI